jgi:hypothetical protein
MAGVFGFGVDDTLCEFVGEFEERFESFDDIPLGVGFL